MDKLRLDFFKRNSNIIQTFLVLFFLSKYRFFGYYNVILSFFNKLTTKEEYDCVV